ncbi:alpha/beta hydrolase [Nanchangia anserum]|uniref:Alpha/beta hydrolase n=1 Tax=Nanchangia anserum TaxID=2692125 RepID=A0A8I0GD57_9ACTO|nr:alpha/beta hydrolase [Nanchangia anserum]MBD3689816.1 alpha/beta hydrolase [Nanchangia anserum]QOX81985.1 alpha/beta hydrolase [Nanchangia anserum]
MPADEPATPPGAEWGPDILGDGFEARRLSVPGGSGIATLIRHRPEGDPQAIPGTPQDRRWCALYVHGWNDYFFQRELARHVSAGGGAFYAIDLHHYGRSLQPDDMPGWCTALSDYAPDLHVALRAMSEDHPGCPIILIGHSTGGLLASLWATRNPGRVAGLWLTSPWLELQCGPGKRRLWHQAFHVASVLRQRLVLPLGTDQLYATSLRGWNTLDGPPPAKYIDAGYGMDPSLAGFDLIDKWKSAEGSPVRAGWIYAITSAHTQLSRSAPLDIPVLLHASTTTHAGASGEWTNDVLWSDAVLNADVLVAAGAMLANDIDIRRYRMRHDPLTSFPDVRQAVWADFHAWTARILPDAARGPSELGDTACYAICP